MKHLETRQEVGGWQLQVSLLALAASHFEREMPKLLAAQRERPHGQCLVDEGEEGAGKGLLGLHKKAGGGVI